MATGFEHKSSLSRGLGRRVRWRFMGGSRPPPRGRPRSNEVFQGVKTRQHGAEPEGGADDDDEDDAQSLRKA
jgi:hypothetical protein